MSTTGVKRNGKGYQSYNGNAPIENITRPQTSMAKRSQKFKFASARRPMPPPVSSEDVIRRSSSIDEFGAFMSTPAVQTPGGTEQNHKTIATFRKAFRAIVTGKPAARTMAKPVWH